MTYPFNTEYTNPIETSIPVFGWTDAVERGEEMTAIHDGVKGKDKLDVPIKMLWCHGGNSLTNQHGDLNRTVKLLRDDSKAELIVVNDIQMTTSARYADYVLPDASTAEQDDYIMQGSAGNLEYGIFASRAVTPLYNCRPIYDVVSDLAERFGIRDKFTGGKTQQEWIKETLDQSRKDIPELPSYEDFKEKGIFKRTGESVIPLKEFREDPEANPLETPSGKIEIYSQQLHDLNEKWEFDESLPGNRITALPEYVATWEAPKKQPRTRTTRCSASATTLKAVPTPVTATWTGSATTRTHRSCGSTSSTRRTAASKTMTWSTRSTTVVASAPSHASLRVSHPV